MNTIRRIVISWLVIPLLLVGIVNTTSHASANNGAISSQPIPSALFFNNFHDRLFSYYIGNNRVLAVYAYDMTSNHDVIIQLTSPSIVLAKAQGVNSRSARQMIEMEQAQVKADLQSLLNTYALNKGTPLTGEIKWTFKEVFNGFALSTTSEMIDDIRKLSNVKNVYDDQRLQLTLTESVPIIHADKVKEKFAVSGAGVIVGIIDTGIDYHHPDLGGGMGEGYKVIGGYDFVNKDNDPLDDHGHGTHVAGIIAAAGAELQGVAPGARLMAFKIVDVDGEGYASTLIAALERANNPDRNPATADAVDIVNISLACPGDADDPVAQAIDNTVRNGIICVTSAGNHENYFSISAPGASRYAITVGAVDKNKHIINSTSRGPNLYDYAIKPDVVAPGLNIQSTWIGGAYHQSSGTSMAAPHVTGVVALLKQLHPDWTPAEIKTAIMNGAVDIGNNPFVQGCGLVDALRSAQLTTLVMPGSISFGIDDLTKNEVWVQHDTLSLINFSQEEQEYLIISDVHLPVGASLHISPSVIKLKPTEHAAINLELIVVNATTAMIYDEPYAYVGTISCQSAHDTINVPVAFLRTTFMRLALGDRPKLGLFIHNRKDFGLPINTVRSTHDLILPPDTYDLLINYNQFYHVIKEQLSLTDVLKLDLPVTAAKNKIQINAIDQHGDHLADNFQRNLLHVRHATSGFGVIFNYVYSIDLFTSSPCFSDFSEDYFFEYILDCHPAPGQSYQLYDRIYGLHNDIISRNDPKNFNHFFMEFKPEKEGEPLFLAKWIGWGYTDFNDQPIFTREHQSFSEPLISPFEHEAFYIPMQQPDSPFLSFYTTQQSAAEPTANSIILKTPYIHASDTCQLSGRLRDKNFPQLFSWQDHQLSFGYGPPHWCGIFQNGIDAIKIAHKDGCFFMDQMFGMQPGAELSYTLYKGNVLIRSGTLQPQIDSLTAAHNVQLAIDPGAYRLHLYNDDYEVHDRPGHLQIVTHFSTGQWYPDKNPPYLTSFQILSAGKIANVLSRQRENIIQFSIKDDILLWDPFLFYQTPSDTTWQLVAITMNDDYFQAALPESIEKGFINLKLNVTDYAQNSLSCIYNPAFYILNEAPQSFDLLTPTRHDTVDIAQPEFSWQKSIDPDDDQISYSLFISCDSTFGEASAVIRFDHLRTNKFSPDIFLQDNNFYFWKVVATDGSDGSTSSTHIHRFWLNYINDKPTLFGIPDTSFFEDDSLIIYLDHYLFDADNFMQEIELNVTILEVPLLMSENYRGDEQDHEKRALRKISTEHYTIDDIGGEPIDPPQFDDVLTYIIDWIDQRDTLSVFINSREHIAKFKSSQNWFGPPIPFIFKATDPQGLSTSDTMTVQVLPVNDAPVFAALPAIQFPEDHLHLFPLRDWFPFVHDVDNDDSDLQWSTSRQRKIRMKIENATVYFNTPMDWYGKEAINIIVQDPDGLKDSTYVLITVTPVNDPPEIINLVDTSFAIDQTMTLRLNDFVIDIDDPDSTLRWSVSQNDSIGIIIDPESQAAVLTSEHFMGTESVEFQVTDPHSASVTKKVKLTVRPPAHFSLAHNYPNPFNMMTQIEFSLPEESLVTLTIFNVLGQKIQVLHDQKLKAGRHCTAWNGKNEAGNSVASGIYFYRLTAKTNRATISRTEKMILLR